MILEIGLLLSSSALYFLTIVRGLNSKGSNPWETSSEIGTNGGRVYRKAYDDTE